MEGKIQKLIETFFEKLKINISSVTVTENKERKNNFDIKIKTEESAIIIGNHGKTLEDIKNILKGIFRKNFEEKFFIQLEVNDYIAKKFDRLLDFISKKIKYVEKTGNEVILPFYNGYERKKIHSYVSNLKNTKIYTKSIGEGKERKMHIFLKEGSEIDKKEYKINTKKISISIDLDGVGI